MGMLADRLSKRLEKRQQRPFIGGRKPGESPANNSCCGATLEGVKPQRALERKCPGLE
jgi:hypothetical protein